MIRKFKEFKKVYENEQEVTSSELYGNLQKKGTPSGIHLDGPFGRVTFLERDVKDDMIVANFKNETINEFFDYTIGGKFELNYEPLVAYLSALAESSMDKELYNVLWYMLKKRMISYANGGLKIGLNRRELTTEEKNKYLKIADSINLEESDMDFLDN
ncbi:MAG: hypothetical protein SLAVMIC_00585 [uncultured marine phage]|uniref:Uncharacterized protein n=1 Tax=uncultured marine phage TaxID=707152 RepID=A0A8D9FRN9_9VIRU|nr:MAG: hypothetical protein SLAVMIC_00585 [uncultured marine phage]